MQWPPRAGQGVIVCSRAGREARSRNRGKRAILGIVAIGMAATSMALAVSATTMASMNMVEINKLKDELKNLEAYVQKLDDRITHTHETLMHVASGVLDLYQFTQKSFNDISQYVDSLSCQTRDAFYMNMMISQRNHIISKMYTDLSAIISSVFSGRLSPIVAPERTIRELIVLNRHLFIDTIFWANPLLIYRYATVVPAWPILVDRIAFVLLVPDVKLPTLAPMYCTISMGYVDGPNNQTAVRYHLPSKLIRYATVTSKVNDNYVINSTRFVVPVLEQCRALDDELTACPATVALTPWTCDTNESLCQVEMKVHTHDEFHVTSYGYAIRASGSCHVLYVNGSTVPVKLHRGFAYVPFRTAGTLKCDNGIAVPIEVRGLDYVYTYEVEPPFDYNITDFSRVARSEWVGAETLQALVVEEKQRAQEWKATRWLRGAVQTNIPWLMLGIGVASLLALLLTLVQFYRFQKLWKRLALDASTVAHVAVAGSVAEHRRRMHALAVLANTGEILMPAETKRIVCRFKVSVWRRICNAIACKTCGKRNAKTFSQQTAFPMDAGVQVGKPANETSLASKADLPPAYASSTTPTRLYPNIIHEPTALLVQAPLNASIYRSQVQQKASHPPQTYVVEAITLDM